MALAGQPVRLGLPDAQGRVAVWGHAPRASRGEAIARRTGAALLRIEDAFIRSLAPGRAGHEAPIGLLIDPAGVHYAPAQPSRLETLLATHPFDDHALLERARLCMARIKALELSKYSAHDPDLAAPAPGYVLVIDQVRDDAALRHGGLDGPVGAHVFRDMLVQAQLDHPGARIVVKTHPETMLGLRPGHFGPQDLTSAAITVIEAPVSPWKLLDGAIAVYTVSSQMGFEAIYAGHRPHVFGLPFYAGWGLTQDRIVHPRRGRKLTRAQVFAGSMLLYPTWYDPCRDTLCALEDVIDHMEALTRAWREDRRGHVALNMRLWKRRHLQAFFGRWTRLRFARTPPSAPQGRSLMLWGDAPPPPDPPPPDLQPHDLPPPDLPPPALGLEENRAAPTLIRLEDGFLRSRGLGAELTPPLSLIADDLGLYYDPRQPSRLDALLLRGLPPGGLARAERLLNDLRRLGLNKYNLGGARPELPQGHRILVPGQVEDDASIRLAAGDIRTNLDLLRKVRVENPKACILFKPHPDVEAGLRPGAVPPALVLEQADMILPDTDPIWILDHVAEIWTMTSTLGFEALLRGVPVTVLGMPFYAGRGLTRDGQPPPQGRVPCPSLAEFVHAALIAYPRYLDPRTGLPCPVELVLERLRDGPQPRPPALRLLAKMQGLLASRADFWR